MKQVLVTPRVSTLLKAIGSQHALTVVGLELAPNDTRISLIRRDIQITSRERLMK